jgi:hypothetical protein
MAMQVCVVYKSGIEVEKNQRYEFVPAVYFVEPLEIYMCWQRLVVTI